MILKGVAICGLLFTIAVAVVDFFGDPRFGAIVYVLALVALVRGVGDGGIVDFRKNWDATRTSSSRLQSTWSHSARQSRQPSRCA